MMAVHRPTNHNTTGALRPGGGRRPRDAPAARSPQEGASRFHVARVRSIALASTNLKLTLSFSETPTHPHTLQHIPVYSSNSDLVFSSTYSVPRLAQGSFIEAWQAVYKTCYGGPKIEVRCVCVGMVGSEHPPPVRVVPPTPTIDDQLQSTNKPIQVTRYGKPHAVSYRFAERLLVHEARHIGLLPSQAPHEEHNHHDFPLRRVYAIGDNPASDIDGANGAGWESILVQTGVFKADQGHHPAKHVVHDVKEALQLIMELEGRPL